MQEVIDYLTGLSRITGMSLEETVTFAKALVADLEKNSNGCLEQALCDNSALVCRVVAELEL